MERMTRYLVALCLACLLPLRASASEVCGADVIAEWPEDSSVSIEITFCDDSDVAASDDCPDGGAKISAGNLTSITYRIDDPWSGHAILGDTTETLTANPYTVHIAADYVQIVGRCSTTAGTYCIKDSECPTGETCYVERRRFTQRHNFTYCWTWQTYQRCNTCYFDVLNSEFHPSP